MIRETVEQIILTDPRVGGHERLLLLEIYDDEFGSLESFSAKWTIKEYKVRGWLENLIQLGFLNRDYTLRKFIRSINTEGVLSDK